MSYNNQRFKLRRGAHEPEQHNKVPRRCFSLKLFELGKPSPTTVRDGHNNVWFSWIIGRRHSSKRH